MNNDDIFSFESDIDILSYKASNGNSFWFYIRDYFFRDFLSSRLLGTYYIPSARRISNESFIYLSKAFVHNCKKISDSEVCFYTPIREYDRDGLYFNQYCEPFVELLQKKVTVFENAPIDWKWLFPRKNKYEIVLTAPSMSISRILAHIQSKIKKEESDDFIAYIRNRLRYLYKIELTIQEEEKLRELINVSVLQSNYDEDWILRKLPKNCKLFISVGASYAKHFPLNRKLKDRGILVADLQHGLFTKENLTYNFNPSLLKDESIRRGVPNILFSYGRWWGEQTNIPYDKIVSIGNPIREFEKERLGSLRPKKKYVVLIGCSHDTEAYIDLTLKLREVLKDKYTVVFRPHPSERSFSSRIITEKKADDNIIDNNGPLYELLNQSYAVISEISTVLFEAVGFSQKIIVWRTSFSKNNLGSHPFLEAESFEKIADLMDNAKAQMLTDDIWDNNWKTNFMSFIHSSNQDNGSI